MLKTHMDAVEQQLLSTSKIPANSGHSLHKGTPRESFIRQFLESHLPETVSIGTGEIIDCNSKPKQQRNQFDIVIYKKNYPKLDFGGGINGFLAESVIATIEVKSTLDAEELENAMKAAINSKKLTKSITQSFRTGYIPPSIQNYVIAYDGPVNMTTVHGWIPTIYSKLGISPKPLPPLGDQRMNIPSDSIDGVFILGKGFLYYDNFPLGFIDDNARKNSPNKSWVMSNTPDGNLLLFFLFLQQTTSNIEGQWLNTGPYLSNYRVNGINYL